MKKHQKSHTIFIFLGILVLIFVLIFGVQYFKSEYSFNEVNIHYVIESPLEEVYADEEDVVEEDLEAIEREVAIYRERERLMELEGN